MTSPTPTRPPDLGGQPTVAATQHAEQPAAPRAAAHDDGGMDGPKQIVLVDGLGRIAAAADPAGLKEPMNGEQCDVLVLLLHAMVALVREVSLQLAGWFAGRAGPGSTAHLVRTLPTHPRVLGRY